MHPARLATGLAALLAACGPRSPSVPDGGSDQPDAADLPVDAATPAPARSLGVARELTTACQIAGSTSGGASCLALEISECPDVPEPAIVELRITSAVGAERGVVSFGSGGGGVVFYNNGSSLVQRLSAQGYTIVERAWRTAWTAGGSGMVASACRYATVLRWLKDQRAANVALCASGNSGGAAELGYTLGFYGSAALLELVVPTGGPVASRWDHYCHGDTDTAWQSSCQDLLPDGFCTGRTVVCSSAEAGGTQGGSCAGDDATLLANSVLAPTAVKDYGTTYAHFMQGLEDCTQPNVPIGLLWQAAVTSPKSLQFLPNTPHEVASSQEGQDALLSIITARCVLQ